MPGEDSAEREIRVVRVFDAPRERVWRAWTVPEELARWWGRRGWRAQLPTITMDVRPGGTFRVLSVSEADGAEMTNEGVYREVAAPERLVIHAVPSGDRPGAVTEVTFRDLGDGRTEMAFRSTLWTTHPVWRAAARGLESAFDRLAELVA
jgi:uncharacterized protein YndB with AHSA1/START domain